MKTLYKIGIIVAFSLITILSLAFAFIEGRMLFSGDWLAYENPFSAFVRYTLRFIVALFALALAIIEFVNLKKQNGFLNDYLIFADGALFIACLVIAFFSSNYVGVVLIAVSALALLFKLLYRFNLKRNWIPLY